MKLERKVRIWIGASLAASVLAAGCSGDFVENITNHYPSYEEAVADTAFQRGWLPRNLPRGAYSIVEAHSVDTNELWVRFKFDQADINSFLSQCERVDGLRLPSAARARVMANWWPEILTEKSGRQLPAAMQAYRCAKVPHAAIEVEAGLILDAEDETAWYWVER